MLEIFFNDLNENGKKKVLNYFNIMSAKEANLDFNIIPLAIVEACDEENNEE